LPLETVFIHILLPSSLVLSGIDFGIWVLGLSFESVVVPVSSPLDSALVHEGAASLTDSLEVKAFEGGTIWLKPPAVAGCVAILEDTLVHSVIRENHSSDSLWLSKLIQGAGVYEILSLNGCDLYVLSEEKFNDFVFNCIQVAILTVCGAELSVESHHVFGAGDTLVDDIKELLEG